MTGSFHSRAPPPHRHLPAKAPISMEASGHLGTLDGQSSALRGFCPPAVGGCPTAGTSSRSIIEMDRWIWRSCFSHGPRANPGQMPVQGDTSASGNKLPILEFGLCTFFLLWLPFRTCCWVSWEEFPPSHFPKKGYKDLVPVGGDRVAPSYLKILSQRYCHIARRVSHSRNPFLCLSSGKGSGCPPWLGLLSCRVNWVAQPPSPAPALTFLPELSDAGTQEEVTGQGYHGRCPKVAQRTHSSSGFSAVWLLPSPPWGGSPHI